MASKYSKTAPSMKEVPPAEASPEEFQVVSVTALRDPNRPAEDCWLRPGVPVTYRTMNNWLKGQIDAKLVKVV